MPRRGTATAGGAVPAKVWALAVLLLVVAAAFFVSELVSTALGTQRVGLFVAASLVRSARFLGRGTPEAGVAGWPAPAHGSPPEHPGVLGLLGLHDSGRVRRSEPHEDAQPGGGGAVVLAELRRPSGESVGQALLSGTAGEDALAAAVGVAAGAPSADAALVRRALRDESGGPVGSIAEAVVSASAHKQSTITLVLDNAVLSAHGAHDVPSSLAAKTLPPPTCPPQPSTAEAGRSGGSQPDAPGDRVRGTVAEPRLPRVVVATIASGRYRALGIAALQSALELFGGDCLPSFHLLTDNTSGVEPALNAVHSPFRQWPDSGLSKFEDLRAAIGDEIARADYFYFMDADVLFAEDVVLHDIAGDLVGVEHPMYPRNHDGWCFEEQAICGFPYDANPKSHAHIPQGEGKMYYTHTGGRGVKHRYRVTTWWYFQSALWGGRSRLILEMLDELSWRVNADRDAGLFSMTVQDERYFNYYMWRESKNKTKNIRVLPHAFLYPYRNEGFGEWVTKHNRPVVYHGTKVPSKLVLGEVQLQAAASNECIGFFLDPLVGMFFCHGGGGMQGWAVETPSGEVAVDRLGKGEPVRFRAATTMKRWAKCIADGAGAGKPAKLVSCSSGGDRVLWRLNSETQHIVNVKSGLCLDAVVKPPHKRDPVLVSECDSDAKFQRWKFAEIGVGTSCTQKWCKMLEQRATKPESGMS